MRTIALLLALAVTGCSTPELERLKAHAEHCRGLRAMLTIDYSGPEPRPTKNTDAYRIVDGITLFYGVDGYGYSPASILKNM
jgi:hypothetical protein